MASTRFPILFTGANELMGVIGIRPRSSYLEIESDVVVVHMGLAFRARFPLAAVRSAAIDGGPVGGWGVHGWRGRWLVNGSAQNLVRVELDPPARAYVVGFPVRLRQLRISIVDPDGLIEAIGSGRPDRSEPPTE